MSSDSLTERVWAAIGKRGTKAADLYSRFSRERDAVDGILSGWLRAGLVTRELGLFEKAPKFSTMEYDEAAISLNLAATPNVPAVRGKNVALPPEYEEACKAIAVCTTLDEAKTWSDKADALAAYARIYHDDRLSVEARRVKLHAYRRMDQLAKELNGKGTGGATRSLRESGLSESQTITVRQVGRVPQRLFDRAVNSEKPPTPSTLGVVLAHRCPGWKRIERALGVLLSITKHHPPVGLAGKLPHDTVARARRMVAEAREWMADFDRTCADREDKAA